MILILPPRGSAAATFFSVRSLRSLPLPCVILCDTAPTGGRGERARSASGSVQLLRDNDSHSQHICSG